MLRIVRTYPGIVCLITAALLSSLASLAAARAPRRSGEEGPEGAGPRYASAIVVEAETGRALFEDRSHLSRAPASTVKTMLELLVMEMVEQGKIKLTDSITTSAWASKIGGSQVYLKQGEVFPLEEMMKAIAIHSSNDACVAVAEHLAGTPEGFVEMMNQRAQELGLHNTRFTNVHGLDDDETAVNVTSARDLALIARELVKHPKVLEWSSKVEDTFRDGKFTLSNTNHLVGKFPGLDGLKTGYTRLAGFCLVATARRNDLRLISVVMGSPSNKVRFSESARLLSMIFSQYKKVPIVREGETLGEVKVERGKEEKVKLVAKAGFSALLRSGQEKAIRRSVTKPEERPAPVKQGEALGALRVFLGDSLLTTVEAVSEREVARMTTWEWIKSWL
jgi:D-alanyl-D-alanine carboxypeptidase (penicillin-binding protein 5/6)